MDCAVAELADRQHGVVARSQLRDIGLSRDAIHHRLTRRRLRKTHRGVYAVGHRNLTMEGRSLAAVLAAGPGAVLSHRAAAGLWGLQPFRDLEVTADALRKRPGIRIHRSTLRNDEVTIVRGIPVTGVSRTLPDLAAVLPPHKVRRIANEAEVQRLGDRLSLRELVARYPRRRGIRTIKSVMELSRAGPTRSELEDRFLSFTRSARLPPPRVNCSVLGSERDVVWHERRLIVELDGRAAHATAAAFERDRARDRVLNAAGWRTVRVTWRQLQLEPDAVARDLRRILV